MMGLHGITNSHLIRVLHLDILEMVKYYYKELLLMEK